MAGLACAITLHRAGIPVQVFEREQSVGGRVKTDVVNGYRLDRGFQVLLTAYPEAKHFLDYDELELRSCYPGSRVWYDGEFHQVSDPFRHPLDGVCSVFNPIGSFFDKVKVGMLRLGLKSTRHMPDDLSTIKALQGLGFSHSMIDRFWKPFMRGVFLENDLSTSVRKFEETFRLFAQGETTLPRRGIGEIPRQMADQIPNEYIHCEQNVIKVTENSLLTEEGKEWQGRAVVLATDFGITNQFLGVEGSDVKWNAVDCLYFVLPENELPFKMPILHLDGSAEGPINNLTFVSTLCECAPDGMALASASVMGRQDLAIDELVKSSRKQLVSWFGESSKSWKNIQNYRIKRAVPSCSAPKDLEMKINGIYRCGDYLGLPSIDSAMRSGRKVAESILESSF